MSKFEEFGEKFKSLQYMNHNQAEYVRDFIVEKNCSNLLEIGFFKGKSSAYMAAILEDLGRGHLTTIDMERAKTFEPNIHETLKEAGLAHRVTPIFAERSHTWELGKMIRQQPRPQFDFCYFDGGHTWDVTGFGFTLVHILLKPGGWIIFDDINWTIDGSLKTTPSRAPSYRGFSPDEKAAPGVRLVFENIVPHFGYTDFRVEEKLRWGIARKPLK